MLAIMIGYSFIHLTSQLGQADFGTKVSYFIFYFSRASMSEYIGSLTGLSLLIPVSSKFSELNPTLDGLQMIVMSNCGPYQSLKGNPQHLYFKCESISLTHKTYLPVNSYCHTVFSFYFYFNSTNN
jgi:hypothetical protein